MPLAEPFDIAVAWIYAGALGAHHAKYWAIFILDENPDFFWTYYITKNESGHYVLCKPELRQWRFGSRRCASAVKIGKADAKKLEEVKKSLENTQIYDYQDFTDEQWAFNAIRRLKIDGYVDQNRPVDRAALVKELEKEEERTDGGEGTYNDAEID